MHTSSFMQIDALQDAHTACGVLCALKSSIDFLSAVVHPLASSFDPSPKMEGQGVGLGNILSLMPLCHEVP